MELFGDHPPLLPAATISEIKDLSNIGEMRIDAAVEIFEAIGHKIRQQILQIVKEKITISVTDLYVGLRLPQALVSRHLSILRKTGFLVFTRQGKLIYYSINPSTLKHVGKCINALLDGDRE